MSADDVASSSPGLNQQFVQILFQIDKFDFVLACVHLKSSGLRNEHMDDLQKEILAIPSLVEAIRDHVVSEKDIMLLGDFNLESHSEGKTKI
jgi:hypothetical protein